jgi:Ca-activated chloride channel family protein
MTTLEARPETFSPAGLRGWRVRLPDHRPLATAALARGKVFVGGGYGSHSFYAFDAGTGREVWSLRTKDDGPTAALVMDDLVAFNTESCTLYVVEAESGKVLWERWLGDPLMAQPAADPERVYMAYPSRAREHRLASFELRTGRPVWESPIPHDIITGPVLQAGKVYVTTYDGFVRRFDAASGAEEWSKDYRATSAPWVAGEEVLLSTREGGPELPSESLSRFRAATGAGRASMHGVKMAPYLSPRRTSPESLTHDAYDASVGFSAAPAAAKLGAVEALTGEYRVYGGWRYQGSRPVSSGMHCYSIAGDEIERVEMGSRNPSWKKKPALEGTGSRGIHTPAVCNGKLFLTTTEGRLRCLKEEDGAELWRVDVGKPMEWSPAVAQGRVLAGTVDGELVCVETGDPADDGWPMWGGGPGHNGRS